MECPFSKKECHHPKTFHVTEVDADGNVTKFDLCQICSQDVLSKEFLLLNTNNVALISPEEVLDLLGLKNIEIKFPTCSQCGIGLNVLLDGGKLGCPNCYDSFKQYTDEFLLGYHNSLKHIGKRPKALCKKKSLDELQKLLQQAIKEERYEDASSFKKSIDEMNS